MITCQFCGAKNTAGTAFCDSCGGALTTAVAAQASAQAQAQAQAAQATAKQQAAQATRAAPHSATGRLPPRTTLGKRYMLLKTVGQGGMAAVYQAIDTRSNRAVAIKEMSQDGLSPDDLREALDSFTAEARLLQGLSQDNLPKVYDSFSEDARHYLVMDFIEGETLEQRLARARGPLPEADVLRWAEQLCAALIYLHTRKPPIIFRDLKPANVMLTSRGKIKLIDFGIARHFTPNRKRDTQALGTPGYAPPEQYGSAQTDPRADVYALGATLYQLLTNYDVSKTPFALPPMRTRNPAVSPHVRLAIERAIRLDRNQRYASVAEFQRDLLHPIGLYLQSGALARSPEEALRLLAAQPQDGADALYSGRVVEWMTRWKRRDLADAATRATRANTDQAAGLRAFLASANGGAQRAKAGPGAAWPQQGAGPSGRGATGQASQAGQPGPLGSLMGAAASAASAGVVAAVTAGVKARMSGQASPPSTGDALKAGMKAAATTFANVAAGSTTLPAVSPRELDFGRVIAGQDASGALTVTGQSGPITGSVKPLAAWIVVDKQQFTGASTLIAVTAHTSAITGQGPQRGDIELTMGRQHMYIPVRVDVAPVTPAAPPPAPSPANHAGPQATRVSPAVNPARPAAAPQPSSQPRRRAGAHGAVMPAIRSDGARFALSVVAALALAVGAPWALHAFLGSWLATLLSSDPLRAQALVAVGAVAAVGGALAPYIGGRRAPGRGRTAVLGAILGAALAFNIAAQLTLAPAAIGPFPEATQVGPLAVTLPVLVAVGAALGAQSLISRALLATIRAIGTHSGLLLLTAAALGGWLGFTITQASLDAAFHPEPLLLTLFSGCGLLLGVALGVSLATPIGALARRFASVRP
ncbi:MAG TPA: serine/threonine-protein kinase [Ktedonobacterales bacterium]|nr:serine/threonine-protein kinase [Ktedonobacterales bacterium]